VDHDRDTANFKKLLRWLALCSDPGHARAQTGRGYHCDYSHMGKKYNNFAPDQGLLVSKAVLLKRA
jgi:hypothetical protein